MLSFPLGPVWHSSSSKIRTGFIALYYKIEQFTCICLIKVNCNIVWSNTSSVPTAPGPIISGARDD